MSCSERHNPIALAVEERFTGHDQPASTQVYQGCEGFIQLAWRRYQVYEKTPRKALAENLRKRAIMDASFLCQTGRVEICAERLSISASVRSIRLRPIKNASCARSRVGWVCEIVRVYKDHGISGTRGRDKRPAFDKLCRDAA